MPVIVNLSSILTVHSPKTSAAAFATLCDQYSTGCCPTFFQHWPNYAWVMYQYRMNYKNLIEPYKLGTMNTQQFLQSLLQIFPFLREAEAVADKQPLVGLKERAGDSEQVAFSLLEKAWNKSIDLDQAHLSCFPLLASMSEKERVYLISNTNELHALEILRQLQEKNPDIKFMDSIDLSVQENKEPIEIAPNIFLCLSYRYQLFKTESDNPHSTMSLLNHLVNKQLSGEDISKICVVSQFPKDLAEATKLGIPANNVFDANQFFKDNLRKSSCSPSDRPS